MGKWTLCALVSCFGCLCSVMGNWQEWWTFDGISGPRYWGVINPSWAMCAKGRKQSPVNVEPKVLVYDPGLKYFHIDKHSLDGTLENTGQFLVFRVNSERMSKMPVNITGGPLAYRYQFEEMIFHWRNDMEDGMNGRDEEQEDKEREEEDSVGGSSRRYFGYRSKRGSEHTIDGRAFPAEIQLYGFNAHLFKNLSQAVHHPHGIVGISILILESDRGATPGLQPITSQLDDVIYKGQKIPVTNLNLAEILPDTDTYVTYEGSTTYPGCWETVTWIVMNKPVYVSRSELYAFRQLLRGEKISPKAPLGNNVRPLKSLNGRTIRTNINFEGKTISPPSAPGFSKYKSSPDGHRRRNHKPKESLEFCPEVFNGAKYQASTWIRELSP